MADTPRLELPLIADGQASAHIPHNQALSFLDAFVGMRLNDFELNTPPGSPADGDAYVIGAAPTGAWSGQSGKIAIYATGWYFFTPRAGLIAWLADESAFLYYDGTEWIEHATGRGDYRTLFYFDDFGSASSFAYGLSRFQSGTGATTSSPEPNSTYGQNRVGLLGITTGTTTTGRAGVGSALPRLCLGQGLLEIEFDIFIPILSDGTNRFTVVAGLSDNTTGINPANHVSVQYSDNVNSGAWVLASSDNSVSGTTNGSGPAVVTGWHRIKIVVAPDGSSFEAFVNGSSIGTRSSNIPTASGRAVDVFFGIFKSLGTTAREIVVDRYWMRFRRSTPV